MTTLTDAIKALDQRKTAAYGPNDAMVGEDVLRRILVGLDVDVDDLVMAMTLTTRTFLTAVVCREIPLDMALSSSWGDGFLTGLLLAELRAREGARS